MTKKTFLIFAIFFLLLANNVYAFCIDRDPPSAPSNLLIHDSPYDDDGNISLSWTAATDGPCENSAVAYYKIYRSDDGINFVLIGTSTSTNYDDFSSLSEGKYWYKVTAVDSVIDNPHEGPGVIATTTVKFNPFCPDGTRYDTCSVTKPKYCDNGNLVDRCDVCGCPSGQSCRADGTCYTPVAGGGGGGFIPTCTENWSCTEWSACSEEGIQTRVCRDLNNCGTTKNKPAETQTCTYVAPTQLGYCGDNICQAGETCDSCPEDCGPCQAQAICGNGVCEEGENYNNCCLDCSCPSGMICNTTTNTCYPKTTGISGITGFFALLSEPANALILTLAIIAVITTILALFSRGKRFSIKRKK